MQCAILLSMERLRTSRLNDEDRRYLTRIAVIVHAK